MSDEEKEFSELDDWYQLTVKGQNSYFVRADGDFTPEEVEIMEFFQQNVDRGDDGKTSKVVIKVVFDQIARHNPEKAGRVEILIGMMDIIFSSLLQNEYIEKCDTPDQYDQFHEREENQPDGDLFEIRIENTPLDKPMASAVYKANFREYLRKQGVKITLMKRSEFFSKICDFCDCSLPWEHKTVACALEKCQKTYDVCEDCVSNHEDGICFRHTGDEPRSNPYEIELPTGFKKKIYFVDVGDMIKKAEAEGSGKN